jgi:hypothetical protein
MFFLMGFFFGCCEMNPPILTGPGCSSVGGGMLSELGPFYPTPDGAHLQQNDYSWNKCMLNRSCFVAKKKNNNSPSVHLLCFSS